MMSLIHLRICIQTVGQGGNKERIYVCTNTNVFNIVGEKQIREVVENDIISLLFIDRISLIFK